MPVYVGLGMKPFRLERGKPWLDIGSHGRAGAGRRMYLSPGDIALIGRTVSRTPEVMVKVTGVAHYIGRGGDLGIETDDGERLVGADAGRQLIQAWGLDMDEDRKRADLLRPIGESRPSWSIRSSSPCRRARRPRRVLAAVRDFAGEEFGRKRRYAMVLHTDEPHPHVHVVVKAVSEDGVRLNISRDTLKH